MAIDDSDTQNAIILIKLADTNDSLNPLVGTTTEDHSRASRLDEIDSYYLNLRYYTNSLIIGNSYTISPYAKLSTNTNGNIRLIFGQYKPDAFLCAAPLYNALITTV